MFPPVIVSRLLHQRGEGKQINGALKHPYLPARNLCLQTEPESAVTPCNIPLDGGSVRCSCRALAGLFPLVKAVKQGESVVFLLGNPPFGNHAIYDFRIQSPPCEIPPDTVAAVIVRQLHQPFFRLWRRGSRRRQHGTGCPCKDFHRIRQAHPAHANEVIQCRMPADAV